MRLTTPSILLAACCSLLAACTTTPTPTLAPAKVSANCAAAAARYYKVPADNFTVGSSYPSMDGNSYDVELTNTVTGQRSKCTANQNGNVSEIIRVR